MRDCDYNWWCNNLFCMKELTKDNWVEKGLIGLLVILNALFLYYWVALSANYCLHYDDVHFLWKMREYSIFAYVREMYMTVGGNFSSYGINGIIFTISNWIGAYRFWPMLFYLLGILMTWDAFRDTPWIRNSGYKAWLGIITLYNVYILTSVDYAVFTWLCAMEYYLFAPALCLLLKYLAKDSLTWPQWIPFFMVALFISGNTVSISTVTFVVLFAYGMYMWYMEDWNVPATWAKPQVRRLLGITALMLICFAVVYVAPGNWIRMATEGDIEQPQNVTQFIYAICVCAVTFLYLMFFYLPYHLIAVALGAWVGCRFPMELPCSRRNAILYTLLIGLSYLIVSVVPLAYLSNSFQMQRNYIQIGFFYLLTFFTLGFLFTNHSKVDREKLYRGVNVSISISTVFLIVIMCFNIKQDVPVAVAYNKAHQDREMYLISLQEAGNKETVKVEKFPSSHTQDAKYNILKLFGKKTSKQGIYYEADASTEPNEYEGHIRKLLHLDFDFVIEEPKQ